MLCGVLDSMSLCAVWCAVVYPTRENNVASSHDEVSLVLHEPGACDLAKHKLTVNVFDRRRFAWARDSQQEGEMEEGDDGSRGEREREFSLSKEEGRM